MIIADTNPLYCPLFFYRLLNNEVDIVNDTFKSILIDNTFFFLPSSHETLTDVTAYQIATGNGYVQNTKTLTGGTLTKDIPNHRSYRTFDGFSWTASGGAFPKVGSLIIYDDDTTDDCIVVCYDFGIIGPYSATYVNSTSYTLSGDYSATIETGMRNRLDQTTDASAAITGVSYASGPDLTTISTTGVDSGLSQVYIGSVYTISDGTPFPFQPLTIELKQVLA